MTSFEATENTTVVPGTWRDLASDLTDQQVAQFEEDEARGEHQRDLLTDAQHCAATNHGTRIFFGDLPLPRGAVTVSSADNEAYKGRWARSFTGSDIDAIGEEDVDSVQVQIMGVQFSDGTVERHIDFLVEGGDEPGDYSRTQITVERARAIATMLTNAADEIERL